MQIILSFHLSLYSKNTATRHKVVADRAEEPPDAGVIDKEIGYDHSMDAKKTKSQEEILQGIDDGRTDLVFDYVAGGGAPSAILMQQCAYYGDVSAVRYLLANGFELDWLGENLDLNGTCFHGHWRLCQFLLDNGADPNYPLPGTGETPLHATLCTTDRLRRNLAMKVLLAHGANPNAATKHSAQTGGFMRDCRTKGETPLHRAAAFGDEETVRMLVDAGAKIDAMDMNGDTPLGWASWYTRPTAILRLLCYGDHRIRPENRSMEANLQGDPHVD